MYDVKNVIFEKYNEGKISDDNLLELLEASNESVWGTKENHYRDNAFQKAVDKIVPVLPSDWRDLHVNAKCDGKRCDVTFTVISKNGKRTNCFKLGKPKQEITKILDEAGSLLYRHREEWEQVKQWTGMTIDYNRDKKSTHCNFTYDK